MEKRKQKNRPKTRAYSTAIIIIVIAVTAFLRPRASNKLCTWNDSSFVRVFFIPFPKNMLRLEPGIRVGHAIYIKNKLTTLRR